MELRNNRTVTQTVPKDWEVIDLGEVILEMRGGAPLKPTDFTEYGYRVLPKGGVTRGGKLSIAVDDIQYCSATYAQCHKTNMVDKQYTVVVLRDLVPSGPNIGLMIRIESDESYILAQGVYGFKVDEGRVFPLYLIHVSNSTNYRRLMHETMVGSTQVHITNTAFKRVHIALPPLPQQHAIAEALSDVDAMINSLDKLIAKKRDIKQAAMQQLLTGKTRLPEFSGEWVEQKLGKLFDIAAGTSKREYIEEGGEYLIVDMGAISTEGKLIASKQTEYQGDFIKCGDLVMPKDDIGGGNIIGRTAYISANGRYILGDHVFCLSCRQGDSRFLHYLINGHSVNSSLRKKVSGSAQLGLSKKSIEDQAVVIPSITEQSAIATILFDMDAEITALEQKREKTRLLKQGMMQELLTGRIRLI